jgi:hypothetical protein
LSAFFQPLQRFLEWQNHGQQKHFLRGNKHRCLCVVWESRAVAQSLTAVEINGISQNTIERRGRRENLKLGKADGRATKSWPQGGAESGTIQVIGRPKVETRGNERVK